jgi:tetratricopeptide (TPR) repeat protein
LRRLTDPVEAEQLIRRALAADERASGPDHPWIVEDTFILASILNSADRLPEIEALLLRAQRIIRSSYGTQGPAFAECLYWESVLLQKLARYNDAESYARKAVAIGEATGGSDHPGVLVAMSQLALVLKCDNRLCEAEAIFLNLKRPTEDRPGFASLQLGAFLNNFGRLYEKMNRLVDAEPLLRRGLEVFLQFNADSGWRHWQQPHSINNYRRLLRLMRRTPKQVRDELETVAKPFGLRDEEIHVPDPNEV